MANLTGWHALILLIVVVLLFGAARLPALAKSVGQSARIFKGEVATSVSTREVDPATLPASAVATDVAGPGDLEPASHRRP